MKIIINNDRWVPMGLRIVGAKDHPHEGQYIKIKPQEFKEIELDLPPGSVPYFKIWENGTAFLSYCEDLNEKGEVA